MYRLTPAAARASSSPTPATMFLPSMPSRRVRIGRAFVGGHVTGPIRCATASTRISGPSACAGRCRCIASSSRTRRRTRLYVTENGGDVVMKSTASGRRWGWLGAVLHWIYFTSLRRHAGLWNEVIVWSSLAGTVMCLFGIAVGRLAAVAAIAVTGCADHRQSSPYAGWMRWHHYLGLIFGFTTMMFVFSGMLSMDPWDWHPGTAPTRDQRERLAGGALVDRRSAGRRASARARGVCAAVAQGDRPGAIPRPLLRERGRGPRVARPAAPWRGRSAAARPRGWRRRRRDAGRAHRGHAVDGRLRRVLLRSRSAAIAAGVARPLRRSAAHVAVFRSAPRHHRAERKSG